MVKKILKGNKLQQDSSKETGSSRPEDAGEGFGGKSVNEDNTQRKIMKNIKGSGPKSIHSKNRKKLEE